MDRKLIDYYPEFLSTIKEYRMITDTEQEETDQLWKRLSDGLDDQFIHSATEHGVERWEEMLGLTPKATASLEERKFLILAVVSGELPYTWRMLEKKLTLLCGERNYQLKLYPEEYKIELRIALSARNSFDDAETLIREMIPANMLIDLSLLYNQHSTYQKMTHKQMSKYSHKQLRNEVM